MRTFLPLLAWGSVHHGMAKRQRPQVATTTGSIFTPKLLVVKSGHLR